MQDGDELILYFGDVASLSGKEASQTGSSVLTEDPMEAALDELKADVEEWIGGYGRKLLLGSVSQ